MNILISDADSLWDFGVTFNVCWKLLCFLIELTLFFRLHLFDISFGEMENFLKQVWKYSSVFLWREHSKLQNFMIYHDIERKVKRNFKRSLMKLLSASHRQYLKFNSRNFNQFCQLNVLDLCQRINSTKKPLGIPWQSKFNNLSSIY